MPVPFKLVNRVFFLVGNIKNKLSDIEDILFFNEYILSYRHFCGGLNILF